MWIQVENPCVAAFPVPLPGEQQELDEALESLYITYTPHPRGHEAHVRSRHPALPDAPALAAAAERLGELRRLARAVRLRLARDLPRVVPGARVLLAMAPWDGDDEPRIVLEVEPARRPALARVRASGWMMAAR